MRLIAQDLSGERGGQPVFSGVDFSLGAGDALIVTGPNGSGKSTLLRIIAGLLRPASGKIGLEGGGEAFPTVSSAAHYLGHQNAMKSALTVVENLVFWRDFYDDTELDVEAALNLVNLGAVAHLPYGYLSTGQRRRAAIARLLVNRRPLWLLDEPTAGLDAESERLFAGLLEKHRAGGGMLIASTHLPLGLHGATELRMGNA